MQLHDKLRFKTYHAERKLSYDDCAYEAEREQCERERAKANGNGSGAPERYCFCDELLDAHGNRLPCPPHHDCQYVKQRSSLIEEASQLVSAKIGDPVGDSAKGYRWTAEFVKAMDRLAKPLLNQSGNGRREQKAI